MGRRNSELDKQELNLSFFCFLCGGPWWVAHKPGSFLKPPGPLVQHEVKMQDGPSQPQPTMTISRSQSPLPPVDWRTYTSSSRRLRPPTPSPPESHGERRSEARIIRETAPLLRYKRGICKGLLHILSGSSPKIKGTMSYPNKTSHVPGRGANDRSPSIQEAKTGRLGILVFPGPLWEAISQNQI